MARSDDLERDSAAWVAAGIITADQRDRIVRFGADARAADPVGSAERRLSLAAEVVVYVGSVLALSGGAITVASAWDDLAVGWRMVVALVVTVVGLGVGHWLFAIGEAGTERVAGYVSSLGVGGAGFLAGLIADEAGGRDSPWVACAVGVGILVASVGVWRNLDRPLQVASGALGYGMAVAGAFEAIDGEWVLAGWTLMASGAVLFGGAHRAVLRPRWIVLVAGGALAYVGAYLLWDVSERLAPAAAALVAVAVVAYGVRFDQLPLVVLGILGATLATTLLLAELFEGTASSAVVALVGLVVVVVVVARSLRDGRPPGTSRADG